MKSYRVTWSIDVEADSPQEAAKEAIRWRDTPADDSFLVTDEDGNDKTVDFADEDYWFGDADHAEHHKEA